MNTRERKEIETSEVFRLRRELEEKNKELEKCKEILEENRKKENAMKEVLNEMKSTISLRNTNVEKEMKLEEQQKLK